MRDRSGMRKALAAVLVAVILMVLVVHFATRTPRSEQHTEQHTKQHTKDPAEDVVVHEPSAHTTRTASVADPRADTAGRAVANPLAESASVASEVADQNVLRVVLEGITEQDAQRTRVTLRGVDHRGELWPSYYNVTWSWHSPRSDETVASNSTTAGPLVQRDFAIDSFFERVEERRNRDLSMVELEVKVCHPGHLIETARVPLSHGKEHKSGQIIYEVRVQLVPGAPHEFWSELLLSVRDEDTYAHLDDVELRCVPTAFMGLGQVPGDEPICTALGVGLTSPIAFLGGRESGQPEDTVTGLALSLDSVEPPQLIELVQPESTSRGVVVYAGAPGYAWGNIVVDVSSEASREVLLRPAGALDLQLTNLDLDLYAASEARAFLWLDRLGPNGNLARAWHQRLDDTAESDGLWFERLEAGEYTVLVKLDAGSWEKAPVLVREKFSIVAGETSELKLELADPPAPPVFTTVSGLLSFPILGGPHFDAEQVRLHFYYQTSSFRDPYRELALVDMRRVEGAALPTWSFHLEDLPPGRYQAELLPFLAAWIVEVPVDGRSDVELVLPELAEVLVETVDTRTGARVPIEQLHFRGTERPPDLLFNNWQKIDADETGRFRFWTPPGKTSLWPRYIPKGLDYSMQSMEAELVPGPQSVRFGLNQLYAIRIEFRDGGVALDQADEIWGEMQRAENFRAIGHDGEVTNISVKATQLIEVSAPGVYEISFEGVGTDRFEQIQPQRVEVSPRETAEVIVELRRK
ncbi:MAG: hypothetical protein AAF581_01795 [Planctomycetota bacterium]